MKILCKCDRCRKEFNPISSLFRRYEVTDDLPRKFKMDLCEDCYKELSEWMNLYETAKERLCRPNPFENLANKESDAE